ncbi:Protein O-mannosyltransferase 2 [Allomyces arbusculus]|nr:Protein O-mannosyltransferase 2 [Allomyces arbusculus]
MSSYADMELKQRRKGRPADATPLLVDDDASGKDKLNVPISTAPTRPAPSNVETYSLYLLTFLAFATRFARIGWSNKVVWDEAHFGKFGSHYIKRDFYFDVHPPLGKTLIGLAGLFAGYDGSFDFESGKEYPPNVNYTAMRMFCALWGALMVPVAYLTARELKMSRWAAFAAASMVLFDNAYTVISRFILLDSMLLFFTVLSFYCFTKFANLQNQPFSLDWWLWLVNTGVSLGLVSSVKWVGFFVVAVVGLYTLENLWDLFGDVSMPKATYIKHWVARIVCLILIPVAIYIASFALHFAILTKSGPGDAQMSSLFQSNLQGNNLKDAPLELAYGAKFTLKNFGFGGGLLHSHVQTYPHGSKQQQVTCYHHKDANNDWFIVKTREAEAEDDAKYGSPAKVTKGGSDAAMDAVPEAPPAESAAAPDGAAKAEASDAAASKDDAPVAEAAAPAETKETAAAVDRPIEYVRNGDIVRLVHASTGKNLHSHPVAGPVTKNMNEVSGYGNRTVGDSNDYWVVEIVDDLSRGKKVDVIHTLTTRLRLRHKNSGCLLRSHSVNLPQWGFKQAEVVCDKRKDRNGDINNMWNIENHWNDRLPKADASHFKSQFLKDFAHLNVAMWTSNNALVPDPDKEPDGLTSSPSEWPLMQVGIRMCSWGDNDIKFYMLGNPLVWWGAIASLGAYAALWALYHAKFQRKMATADWNLSSPAWAKFIFAGKWLVAGWFLHYVPFGIMGRVTYLHHYFPALYFTILLAAFVLDHVLDMTPKVARHVAWIAVIAAVTGVFVYFAPMTFGFDWPAAEFAQGRSWMPTWKLG